MSSRSNNRRSSRPSGNRKGKKGNRNAAAAFFGPVGGSGARGMNPVSLSDLLVIPPDDMSVPNRIPRNIDSQVFWSVEKIPGTLSVAAGVTLSQVNFSYALTSHDQAASLQTLFDQWTLPMISISFDSIFPPGSTNSAPVLYTALDFDSAQPLATPYDINICNYPTCEVAVMEPGSRMVRSIRPCLKAAVNGTSGSATNRMWVDTNGASAGTPFYGIRTVLYNPGNISLNAIETTATLYFAFRNVV